MKKSLVLGAAIILSLSLASCNGDNKTTDNTIHVESVSVASIHELEIGETFTVGTNTVTVLPDNATDKSYSLSSSDNDVFTTSGYMITAVGEGTADLTVTTTDGGFTASTLITVVGTGGDENPNTGGEGGGGEPDTGGGEPEPTEPDKDVTITTDPTSITVKGGETASFTITVTEGAAIQSVVSDNDAVVVAGSGADWTVTATNNGESNITATITITAGGEGFNTATATLPVTVTPADEYTYKMIIDNADSVPTTGWVHNNTESTFTFAPKLETYNRGTLESTTDLSASDVTVSVSNSEDTANQIIAVSGLTISPAGKAGTVTVTVAYSGELSVSETYSYTVTVDETYSYEHTLKIDTTNVPESEKVGDGGFDIVANLITTTTADSWGTTETSTVAAQESDVTISVSPEDAMTVAGLHVVPTANVTEETTITITVVWSAYSTETTASDSISLTVYPKDSATYTMTITNENDFTGDWYTEDDPKTIKLSITSSDDEENPIDVDTLVEEGKITARAITDNVVDINGLTITPVAKGTTTIYVVWTEHTEANASISVTVLEHTYKLSITNKEELAADWSIEDGARTLEIELTSDREDINKTASANNVKITYDDDAFTTSDSGFTLTPAKTGSHTVTATWVDESLAIGADGVDSFTVNVNDYVKITGIELDKNTIDPLGYGEANAETITATLIGANGATPTSQSVSWEISEASGAGVSISYAGLECTVYGTEYGATATIKATATEGSQEFVATCSVVVEPEPETAGVKVIAAEEDPVIMSSVDDRGVYVLGTSDGTYITYNESSFGTSTHYNDAVAVRVIPADGSYYLQINDKYLTTSLTLVDDTSSANAFVISSSGVTSNGTTLYVNDGLATSGTGVAYILDLQHVEAETTTTGGEFYLTGTKTDGGIDKTVYFNGTITSNKMMTTYDLHDAAKVTIEHIEDNKYTMVTNGVYISLTSSGTDLTHNATLNYVYYDSEYQVWADSTGTRYLGTNTSTSSSTNLCFSQYGYKTTGALDTSYPEVSLYQELEVPDVKGITVSLGDTRFEAGTSTPVSVTTYPSVALVATTADLTLSSQTGTGSVSYNDTTGDLTGETEGEVSFTFSYGSVSDTISATIEANSSGTVTVNYSYTFASGNLGSSATSGSNTFNGLTWSWTAGASRGWDSSRGIQISTSGAGISEDDPFVLTANFGEEIELTTITLNCSRASAGSGNTYFSIILGGNSIASSVSFTDTSATDHTYSGSYTGKQLDISFWTSDKKSIYIKSISFTIIAPSGFSLS